MREKSFMSDLELAKIREERLKQTQINPTLEELLLF